MNIVFNLVKKAKSVGGDRYEAEKVSQLGKPWTVWFPQEISRKTGESIKQIIITIK